MVLVGVSIVALQHDPAQFTEGLLKMPRFPTVAASQALLAKRSASNATVTAPFQNEQGDELKLDDIIGSFGVEATIYKIPNSRGERNEQGNREIEGKSDATPKLDSNSQFQEEILLIDITDPFSSGRIFSNANRTELQHAITVF